MKKCSLVSLFLLFSLLANAQWNNNTTINNPISTSLNDQQDARIVGDGSGGAIITWVDFRNDVAAGDIYVQRIDRNGFTKWAANGVAVCSAAGSQAAVNITESDNGSAIMVWTDRRSPTMLADIYAQKIDSNGVVLWTSNGATVTQNVGEQQNPKILSDGLGGAYVVFEDSTSANNYDISAQHINSAGVITWATQGVSICGLANNQKNPRIETDNAGGAFVTWQDFRNGNDYDIYAQRIDINGVVQWTTSGVAVCNAGNAQVNPKIEPDGRGGALIAWVDKRNGTVYDIFAQRVSSNGTALWSNNGVVICNASNNQSAVEIKALGTAGAVIAWKDDRNPTYSVYAQRVDLNGAAQWSNNGIYCGTGINPNMTADLKGGVILTWQDSVGISWNVYSIRLNAAGNFVWGGSILESNAAKGQTSPKNVADGHGGAITCWQDNRSGVDLDIYCHHSDSNSVSGIKHPLFQNSKAGQLTIWPNPCSDHAIISGNTAFSKPSMYLYDASGKLILEKKYTTNPKQLELNTRPLNSGVYLIKLQNEDGPISTGRINKY